MFELAFWGIWLLGMTLWSIWYWKVKVPRSRRARPKYPPTEVLGTLDQATLVLLTQEDLDWWNQQRELMGLRSGQRYSVARNEGFRDILEEMLFTDPSLNAERYAQYLRDE